jgi:hypothetical protein
LLEVACSEEVKDGAEGLLEEVKHCRWRDRTENQEYGTNWRIYEEGTCL